MPAVVLHDQKIHVIPHLSHLDVRNAMVPLMILFAICGAIDVMNANSGANGVT